MDPQNFRWNDPEFFPHIFISQMLHWSIAVRTEAFSLFYIDFYFNDRDILIQILSGCSAFPFMGCHGCCFFWEIPFSSSSSSCSSGRDSSTGKTSLDLPKSFRWNSRTVSSRLAMVPRSCVTSSRNSLMVSFWFWICAYCFSTTDCNNSIIAS